jgi:hypothetical protein
MPNNNQRPWYKDPRILISAIVVILAAIIGGTFVIYASFPQTPTGPIFKEICGDTDTDGDYEISWESARRAIFYILQEDEEPLFTSPRTLHRGFETKKVIYSKSNGDYYYRVRACNDAGESEWSPIRKITVIISITPPPTPTYTHTPTPTYTHTPTPTPTPPTLSVEITYTSREASSPTKVEGTVSKALKEGEYMWIAVNHFVCPGDWWPQTGGPIKPYAKTLTWKGIAYIGAGKQDIGKEFEIAVLIVDEELNSKFRDYMNECEEKQDWPPITKEKIQKGIIEEKIFDCVTVVLKEVK